MLHNFETIFRPAAAKQPGYIDVKMLKLRSTLMGKAPAGVNYRFALTYRAKNCGRSGSLPTCTRKCGPRSRTR